MVLTVLFLAVLACVLAGVGVLVRHSGPAPDVEPAFARRVAEGLRVLWSVSEVSARHTEELVDELRPGSAPVARRTRHPDSELRF
ncbi:hypothetical protein [Saccharomonospora sp. NB11]|uniref:hypothetical protein n=1 Tax=Saccharomonospora sp. NB11 TaxID=1642298 RepID=UPI0018D12693|nr:hypothetical protein [Saccharomonospora sp. NB11]